MKKNFLEVKVEAHMDSLTKKSASVTDLLVYDEEKDDIVQLEMNDELKEFLSTNLYVDICCDFPFFEEEYRFTIQNRTYGKETDDITTKDFLRSLSNACKVIKQKRNKEHKLPYIHYRFDEYFIEKVMLSSYSGVHMGNMKIYVGN